MIQGAGLCYGTTWKVIVRTGFPTLFHRRRFVAWIAITAMLAQTLVAGFASAHAAKSPADVAGVICHHDGSGSEPADTPDTGKGQPDCCVFCTASAVAIVKPPMLLPFVPPHAATAAPSFSRPAVVVARSIVRAGQSQAPPRIA
jgi:hypothetical protein